LRRLNEEKELQHRLDQVEHLRQMNARNRNPRLVEAADLMEQRALERYDQRVRHIEQHESRVGKTRERIPGQDTLRDQARTATSARPSSSSLSNFSDGFKQRLSNEQRHLRQRLDTADRLRQMGRNNGDEQLLDTADRIEADALRDFDRRLQRMGEPLTPDRQSQLDDFFQRSISDVLLGREAEPMMIQDTIDLENTILDRPVRNLLQDVRRFIGR